MALLEKYKYSEGEKEKVYSIFFCKKLPKKNQNELQVNCLQLELELGNVAHERNELNDQLVNAQRKKDALNEELMRLRHRIEQVSETNARVNKHLEDLVKECEEKQVLIWNYFSSKYL